MFSVAVSFALGTIACLGSRRERWTSQTKTHIISCYETVTEKMMMDLCMEYSCSMCGHPNQGGLHMFAVDVTDNELAELKSKYADMIQHEEEDSEATLALHSVDSEASKMRPKIERSWGLDRIDQKDLPLSGTPYTSLGAQGEGVHIYVVDSGVRTSHQQFGGRAFRAFEFFGQATTRFQKGFPARARVCAGSTDIKCSEDQVGHGTHCAGTAASQDYGVAPRAMIHAVKVFNNLGKSHVAWIANAVDWAMVNHHTPAVFSMSLSAGGRALTTAVDEAVAAGIVVVVAAGNRAGGGQDACKVSPANIKSAITVGSTTSEDERSGFSNFGDCIDIFAPGSEIRSTSYERDDLTVLMSGTSMACPHVAGAAAIRLSDGMQASDVRDHLKETATKHAIKNLKSEKNLLLQMTTVTPKTTTRQ